MKTKTFTESGLSDKIKEFLHRHKDVNRNYKYIDLIDGCIAKDFFLLNTNDLLQSELDIGRELHDQLYFNPKLFIESLTRAIKETFAERYEEKNIKACVDQVSTKPSIVEALGNQFIEKIVTVSGMVISKSEIYNLPSKITYYCQDNHSTIVIAKDNSIISKPVVCSNNNCKLRDFDDWINPIDFERHRNISVKSDEDFSFQSDEIAVDLTGVLTEMTEAGDRIQVTGIIKPTPTKKAYQNIIKALWIEKLDDVDYSVSEKDEQEFKKIIEEPNFHSKMINSIAPSIHGNDPVKESLLIQRIGAPNRIHSDGTMDRGWFNNALWGDGGLGKSRIGEWEVSNLPKTQMVGSRGATDKGLLLGLEEDATGKKAVRAGAFVRCRDGGVVILDEFPRLPSEVIDGLMTTLQNGIASISKAGHQVRVRADAGLLATGNAYNEEWNPHASLKENLNMSTPLLQRFDYHWIFIDNPNETTDRLIAHAKLYGTKYDESVEPYSAEFLAKYCQYVKKFNPKLTDEVSKYLEENYIELRKDQNAKENGISPRHLDTMIRTTLAFARMYQRGEATVEDADKALSLMKINLSQRNISVSEADTYLTRQYNRAIRILKNEGIVGLSARELFDKLITTENQKEIETSINDLGKINSISKNKKWREVLNKLRASSQIQIISEKPLVLAYKNDPNKISSYA